MPDSTLNRRSVALYGLNLPNKLSTEDSGVPKKFCCQSLTLPFPSLPTRVRPHPPADRGRNANADCKKLDRLRNRGSTAKTRGATPGDLRRLRAKCC